MGFLIRHRRANRVIFVLLVLPVASPSSALLAVLVHRAVSRLLNVVVLVGVVAYVQQGLHEIVHRIALRDSSVLQEQVVIQNPWYALRGSFVRKGWRNQQPARLVDSVPWVHQVSKYNLRWSGNDSYILRHLQYVF